MIAHLMARDVDLLPPEQQAWLAAREQEIDPMFHVITYRISEQDLTWLLMAWPDLAHTMRLPAVRGE